MQRRNFPPLPFVIRVNRWLLLGSLVTLLGVASAIVYRFFFDTAHPLDTPGTIIGFAFLALCVIGLPRVAYACITRPAAFIFSESGIEQLSPLWPRATPVFIRWEEIGGVSAASGKSFTRKDGPIVMTIIPMNLGMRSSRMRAMIIHYRRIWGGIPPDWTSPATEDEIKRINSLIFLAVAVLLALLIYLRYNE